jgi:hypothetical protein
MVDGLFKLLVEYVQGHCDLFVLVAYDRAGADALDRPLDVATLIAGRDDHGRRRYAVVIDRSAHRWRVQITEATQVSDCRGARLSDYFGP